MTGTGAAVRTGADSARKKHVWMLPSRELLILFLHELARTSCLWLLIYGGANWLTGLHHYRVRLWTPIDLTIPFVPATAVVYLSLMPMLWISTLVLHTSIQLRSFAKSLNWLIVLSGVGFLLLPGEQAFPSRIPTEYLGTCFYLADFINLDYNFFPSLHVGMAVVCAFAYSRSAPTWVAILFWLWAAMIASSALLMHQHYLADVAAGALLGFVVVMVFGILPQELECKTESRGV